MDTRAWMRTAATIMLFVGAALSGRSFARADEVPPLPERLSETGLFAPGSVSSIRPNVIPFSPQYPLWSDAATKRRWIALPPGTSVDGSRPDAWEFPAGTRLWKEFALGRRVETRYIERLADGTWRFAAYVWNETGTEAFLAAAEGVPALPVAAAPGGQYGIPSETDCRACHEGAAVPVLGFSALQLSPDRDPLAPHAESASAGDFADLPRLVAMGALRNLPRRLLDTPPRIKAATPTERAALGYLHGNCGHCHSAPNDAGTSVPAGIVLAQSVADELDAATMRRSLVDAPSRFRQAGVPQPARVVVPGHSQASVLSLRMRSRDPRVQMPPLGTVVPDAQALAIVERWINQDLIPSTASTSPTATDQEPSS